MSQSSLGVVLVTTASRQETVAIAQAVVSRNLAACVNLSFPFILFTQGIMPSKRTMNGN